MDSLIRCALASRVHTGGRSCSSRRVITCSRQDFTISFAAVNAKPSLARTCLDSHGVALVKGVVRDAETINGWVNGVKGFLRQVGHGDFEDPLSVFDAERWPHEGDDPIFSAYGAGHLPAAWDARLHPNVRRAFSCVWGTPQLVTSWDATNAERPRSTPLAGSTAVKLHVDQRRSRAGEAAQCFQGVLSLTRTTARTGGTTVVPGDHNDWYLLSDRDLQLLERAQLKAVHVETEPGDLLLWDSRTVHCGRRARDALRYKDWRFAFYICMWPASLLSEEDRGRKRRLLGLDGADRAETTTHWPDGRATKPQGEREGGIKKAPEAVLSSRMALQLAGAVSYGDATATAAATAEGTPAAKRVLGAVEGSAVNADSACNSSDAEVEAPER